MPLSKLAPEARRWRNQAQVINCTDLLKRHGQLHRVRLHDPTQQMSSVLCPAQMVYTCGSEIVRRSAVAADIVSPRPSLALFRHASPLPSLSRSICIKLNFTLCPALMSCAAAQTSSTAILGNPEVCRRCRTRLQASKPRNEAQAYRLLDSSLTVCRHEADGGLRRCQRQDLRESCVFAETLCRGAGRPPPLRPLTLSVHSDDS